MRISSNQKQPVVSNNQVANKVEFGITKNVSKLFYMLRDGFYAYKVQTMVQEYMSNARDSHRKAGNSSTPIKVILPTKSNPSLVIKDLGTGMNFEQLQMFSSYLDSSKDQDDSQTGGFGIGGKIGFAYTDSFMLISRQDGQQWTVFANKAESENGTMNISAPEKTNLPNGVDVIIPIKQKDFNEVYRATMRCGMFWDVKPEIVNDKILQEELNSFTQKPAFQGKMWDILTFESITQASSFANITTGNESVDTPFLITVDKIVYQLSEQIFASVQAKVKNRAKTLVSVLFDSNRHDKRQADVILHFGTNEIVVVGNREGITDRESNIDAIVTRLIECNKELETQLLDKVENQLTPAKSFSFLYQFAGKFGVRPQAFLTKYKNREVIEVSENSFNLPDETVSYTIQVGRRRYGNGMTPLTKIVIKTFDEISLETSPKKDFGNYGSRRYSEARVYFLMKDELSMPVVKRKVNQMSELIAKNSFVAHRVTETELAKLRKLEIIKPGNLFTIENAGNQLRKRVVNENEVNCFRVTKIITPEGYGSTNSFAKEVVVTDLKTIRKGIAVTNKDFQKFVNNLAKDDVAWIEENKVNFYILGEATIAKLEDLKTMANLSEMLTKCSRANEYFFEQKSTNYRRDSESVTAYLNVFFNKTIIEKSKGKFESLCFDKTVGPKEFSKFKKLSHTMYPMFETIYAKEIAAYKKFMSELVTKNPFLNVVTFQNEINHTREYPINDIVKNMEQLIKF